MPEPGQPETWSSPFEVDQLLGQELGGAYRITRRIGAGGMGSVYEAKHLRLNRRVAVKVLNRELVSDATYLERFRREAEVTSKLKHKHIAEVLDFNALPDGTPYMVMEYLEGEDLSLRIKKRGMLTPGEMVPIIDGIANALAAAHKIGVLHRDIKPANIFIGKVESTEIAKLLDFGAAKQQGQNSNLTAFGQVLGSIHYVSPEQARGQDLDARTDLFSLGIVLYESLTGHNPFEAATPNDTLFRIVGDRPTPMAQYAPSLAPAIEEVLHRALAKKRDDRYGSVIEFADAARQALDQGRGKKKPLVIGAKPREDEPVLQGMVLSEEDEPTPQAAIPTAQSRERQERLTALHEAGLLDAESYREGFAFERLEGDLVFDRLVEAGRLDERVLLRFWVGQSKSKYLTRETLAKSKIPADAKSKVALPVAERFDVLPVMFNPADQTLTVASADCSTEQLERVRAAIKGERIQGIRAMVGTVRAGIRRAYLADAKAFTRPEPPGRRPAPAEPPPPPVAKEPPKAMPPPPPPPDPVPLAPPVEMVSPTTLPIVETSPAGKRRAEDEFDTLPPQRPLTIADPPRPTTDPPVAGITATNLPPDASIRDPLMAGKLLDGPGFERALALWRERGGFLGDAVLRLGLVPEVEFLRTFAELYGVRFVKSDKVIKVAFAPDMLERFSCETAESLRAMPFSQNPQTGETHVIAAVPLDPSVESAVVRYTGAKSVTLYLATPGAVFAALRRWYYGDTQIFSEVTPNGAGPALLRAARGTSGETVAPSERTAVREVTQAVFAPPEPEERETKTVEFSAIDVPMAAASPSAPLSPAAATLDFQRRVELQPDRAAMVHSLLEGVLAVFPAVSVTLALDGSEAVSAGLRLQLRDPVPAAVMASAQAAKGPHAIIEIGRDERLAHSSTARSGKVKSLAAVALRGRERSWGTLVIDASVVMGPNELQVVEALGTLCAARLEDLERLEQLRLRDKERWRHGRFLPASRLSDAYNGLVPGLRDDGLQIESSLVYAKLRGIGALTERMEPQAVMGALNHLWSQLSEVVVQHGGCIERIHGEAMMALWSPLVTGPGDAATAIQCALALAAKAPTIALDGHTLPMRVGVHSGPVVLGLVGAEHRRDYAAIGPHARMAAKLCDMALDGQVLCSQDTINRAPAASGLKPIPLQPIEGFGASQMVYLIGASEAEEVSLGF